MGIEKIKIVELDAKFQPIAQKVDDGDGELKEEEISLFAGATLYAYNSGELTREEFDTVGGILGFEKSAEEADETEVAKAQTQITTNPIANTDSKKDVKRKKHFVMTALNQAITKNPKEILADVDRTLDMNGYNQNDPTYKELRATVQKIYDAIYTKGADGELKYAYHDKDSVDGLEKKIKAQMPEVFKKNGFAKDVLEAFVKNAEHTQRQIEFEAIQKAVEDKYDSVDNCAAGIEMKDRNGETKVFIANEETLQEVIKDVRKEYKKKGSYYEDILNKGSFFNKTLRFLTLRKPKMSEFEKEYAMPKARRMYKGAQELSSKESSGKVRSDANAILKKANMYDKYTKKAKHRDGMSAGEKASFEQSDMKISRKNIARENTVLRIRKDGLSEDTIIDAVDKRSTFGSKITLGLLFKKRTDLFEALKASGLISKKADGKYDVSMLSMLIGDNVGANYKLDRTSSEFKALSEKMKTASALSVATKLKALKPEEAKMLVEMCGYKCEGKDWLKAIMAGTIGALTTGLSAAAAVVTNPRAITDFTMEAHQTVNVPITCSSTQAQEIKNQLEALKQSGVEGFEGAAATLTTAGVNILIKQDAIIPYLHKFSKHIVKSALKAAIPGFVAGFIAGMKDSAELPIASTQFNCTTLEEYKARLDNEVANGAITKKTADMLYLLANRYTHTDKNGKVIWDCESFKTVLNNLAGDGGLLNREERQFSENTFLEIEKNHNIVLQPDENSEDEDGNGGGDNGVDETITCFATPGKEDDKYEDVQIPTLRRREVKAWKAGAMTFYPCLAQNYGPDRAGQILKAVQAVRSVDNNEPNYDIEKLLKLIRMSVKDLEKLDITTVGFKPGEFDMKYYIGLRLSDDLPETLFMPNQIGECDRKQNVKVGRANVSAEGSQNRKAPTTGYKGYSHKTADGRSYVDFCEEAGGGRAYVPAGKTAQDVCNEKQAELRKQGKNVTITLQK